MEQAEERTERMARDYALAGTIEDAGVEWFRQHWAQQPIIQSQQQIPLEIRGAMEARRKKNRAVGLAGSLRGMGQGAVAPAWSGLAAIDVPVLLVTGDQDERYTRIAERALHELPQAEHARIPGVGHCAQLEAVDQVSLKVEDFLAAIE